MSSGYTPLFSSLTTGTLCGKWPDIGLWAIVLSQADKRGVLDVTPDYLALVTGLPVEQVAACMQRFCQPDPRSRTKTLNGARLELIDPENRDWGWRIVNHGKYREKARLMAKDSERTASGRDAERKRDEREKDKPGTQSHPRPPVSPEVPLSDADADVRISVSGVTPTEAGRACRLMKDAGCMSANPSHPKLLEALAAGVKPEELQDVAKEFPGKPMAYIVATAHRRKIEGGSKNENSGGSPGANSADALARRRGESLTAWSERVNRYHDEREAAAGGQPPPAHLGAHDGDLRGEVDQRHGCDAPG